MPDTTPSAAPELIKDGSGSYIGEIRMFGCQTTPKGWLECNGQEYKVKDYPVLTKVIGNLWGSTSKDTFLVPDLRGSFVRGWNHGRTGEGADPDISKRNLPVGAPGVNRDVVGSYQLDAVGEHSHSLTAGSHWGDKGKGPAGWGFDDGNVGNSTLSTDAMGKTETRPKNSYVMFCIRAI